MTQVLKLTAAILSLFFIMAFVSGVVEENMGVGLYYGIMFSGAFFFPLLIFVLLYHFLLDKRFNLPNLLLRFLVKSILLILLSFVALFVWAILEFIVTTGCSLDFEWIVNDYKNEYLNYMPLVIILALIIPAGHYFFRPRKGKTVGEQDKQ